MLDKGLIGDAQGLDWAMHSALPQASDSRYNDKAACLDLEGDMRTSCLLLSCCYWLTFCVLLAKTF